MKQCTRCGEQKPESEYYLKRGKPQASCKACVREKQRAYNRDNLDKIRVYREENRSWRNESRRDWYLSLRKAAIAAYGGACACCGEAEYAFLVFDHVDGGGMRQRIEQYGGIRGRSGGHRFLVWLRDHGYPPEIQVLCANCNMAKTFSRDGCPHVQT